LSSFSFQNENHLKNKIIEEIALLEFINDVGLHVSKDKASQYLF